MTRTFGDHTVYLGVLSAGRSAEAAAMAEVIGPATWHVPVEQWDDYRAAGIETLAEGFATNVSVARNKVLDAAGDQTCIMLDDELHPKILLLIGKEKEERQLTFAEAAEILLDRLENSGLHLAATSHAVNKMFARMFIVRGRPEQTRTTIQGGCLAVKPSPIRFDEDLAGNEEFDFVIKHWETYGGALRVNDLLLRFGRGTPGGIHTRPDDWRRRCTEIYLERYPEILRPGPDGGVALRRMSRA